jgi:DNA polymerase V
MFAIVDCNNFYASCERLFRPDLANKPIIVLSNNDGCVIARSNEAKDLNIKMGQPYFQIQDWCQKHQIHVFSSNYTLYGDLSARVMQTIEAQWPDIEIYSIDEAFLNLKSLPPDQHETFCLHLREKIFKDVGIPTSIGIGPSKTLAKAANYLAKKSRKKTVFTIYQEKHWLEQIPIEEIWGIGRQWAKKLKDLHIYSALDLSQQSAHFIRQQFSLPLMQTTLELQGISCLQLNPPTAKKSIVASKSFGRCQTEQEIIAQAISHHCARATEKLRQQQGFVALIDVFIRTNPFQEHRPQYANHCQIQLPEPTDDIRIITDAAKKALARIFKKNHHYHKVGVAFPQILYQRQQSLFDTSYPKNSEALMCLFDDIKKKYGRHSIRLAAEGKTMQWKMKSLQRSPAYTTRWDELPKAKA